MNGRRSIDIAGGSFPKVTNGRYQVLVGTTLQNWYWSFAKRWRLCQACPLHVGRNSVVQFRGKIPAKVLFVGEAPGDSEDELGRPFVHTAPAGRCLDEMIEEIGLEDGDYCIINIVGCKSKGPPDKTCIKACHPRVIELIDKISPRLVVLMGQTASKGLLPGYDENLLTIQSTIAVVHPSAIAQSGKESDRKRFVLTVRQALESIHA